MNENTSLLSPEREAEIRGFVTRARAFQSTHPGFNDEHRDPKSGSNGIVNDIADLLTALDAQREQFRQALVGLLFPGVYLMGDKGEPIDRWIRDQNIAIQEVAASLGIDLQDPL